MKTWLIGRGARANRSAMRSVRASKWSPPAKGWLLNVPTPRGPNSATSLCPTKPDPPMTSARSIMPVPPSSDLRQQGQRFAQVLQGIRLPEHVLIRTEPGELAAEFDAHALVVFGRSHVSAFDHD